MYVDGLRLFHLRLFHLAALRRGCGPPGTADGHAHAYRNCDVLGRRHQARHRGGRRGRRRSADDSFGLAAASQRGVAQHHGQLQRRFELPTGHRARADIGHHESGCRRGAGIHSSTDRSTRHPEGLGNRGEPRCCDTLRNGGLLNGSTSIAGCTGLVPQSGVAICATIFAQLGSYTITARYNGDANTSPGTAILQLSAARVVAGIYAASAPTAPVFGVPVTVTALLLGANGVAPPGGTVSFYDGATLAGVAKVGADGRASLPLSAGVLAVGQHTFLASYSGDANYASVTAAPMAVIVGKASTATALNASFGMPFTATVSVLAPGAGMPTGTVQFLWPGAPAGTAPVVQQNGMATASMAAGSWSGGVWAVYQGDANFSGSGPLPPASWPAPRCRLRATIIPPPWARR